MRLDLALRREQRDAAQRQRHDRQRAAKAELGQQRHAAIVVQRRPGAPDVVMRRGPDRAEDEEEQHQHHARRAAAHGEQRARGAAAADLHPDPEQERPQRRGDAHRQDVALRRQTDGGAVGHQRKGQQAADRDQQHLRAQPRAAPLTRKAPPRCGEAERGVIEREPRAAADQRRQRQRAAVAAAKRHDGQKAHKGEAKNAGLHGRGLRARAVTNALFIQPRRTAA